MGEEAEIDAQMKQFDPEEYNSETLRKRHQDISEIEQETLEICEMFHELRVLVNEQDSLIKEINHNLGRAKEETKKAGEELIEAEKQQMSMRCLVM